MTAPTRERVTNKAADGGPAEPPTVAPVASKPARHRLNKRPWAIAGIGLIVPAVLLALWHWSTAVTGYFPIYQLPPPASVWDAGVDLIQRGELWTHVAISTQRVLIGFLVGATLGLAVGAIVGLSNLSSSLLSPTIGALRAVPSLAWIPLLLIWLKIGEDSKVTLIAIGAFFPVYTTVSAALRHVDPHLSEVGRAFGLRGFTLFRTIQLPAVIPSVISGLRLAMAQSWLFLVAAELAGASMGLGFLLTDSQNNGRVDRVLLAIVLLALLGVLTDIIIGFVEKRLLRKWS